MHNLPLWVNPCTSSLAHSRSSLHKPTWHALTPKRLTRSLEYFYHEYQTTFFHAVTQRFHPVNYTASIKHKTSPSCKTTSLWNYSLERQPHPRNFSTSTSSITRAAKFVRAFNRKKSALTSSTVAAVFHRAIAASLARRCDTGHHKPREHTLTSFKYVVFALTKSSTNQPTSQPTSTHPPFGGGGDVDRCKSAPFSFFWARISYEIAGPSPKFSHRLVTSGVWLPRPSGENVSSRHRPRRSSGSHWKMLADSVLAKCEFSFKFVSAYFDAHGRHWAFQTNDTSNLLLTPFV